MTLFTTVNQFKVFISILLLGSLGGLVFQIVNIFCNCFTKIINIKIIQNKENNSCCQLQKSNKKQQKKANKKIFYSIKKHFLIIAFYSIKYLLCFFPPLVFIVSIMFSWFVNYNLNYGFFRLEYVVFWIIGFLLIKLLFFLVAKMLTSFYNKKKDKSCE